MCGVLEMAKYQLHQRPLSEGDFIFLYTDGLFSAGNGTDFVNWKLVHQFASVNKDHMAQTPDQFLEDMFWYFHLIHKSDTDSGEEDFTDDVAMMLLRVKDIARSPESSEKQA